MVIRRVGEKIIGKIVLTEKAKSGVIRLTMWNGYSYYGQDLEDFSKEPLIVVDESGDEIW